MSVAFRRESEEEHLEPKYELPIPPGPNLVTARGLALIDERLDALKAELSATTEEAPRIPIQRALRYWNTRRSTAELAPVPSGARVEFGTDVVILLRGAEKAFRIVGDDEADPAAGLLSFNAPLARAILGAEPGDLLPFGGDDEAVEILTISVSA